MKKPHVFCAYRVNSRLCVSVFSILAHKIVIVVYVFVPVPTYVPENATFLVKNAAKNAN